MSNATFAKCFTSKEADKMKQLGFTFFKEESGVYWFLNDSNISFSQETLNVEFSSSVNC